MEMISTKTDEKIISFIIDNQWTVEEFTAFFNSIVNLYHNQLILTEVLLRIEKKIDWEDLKIGWVVFRSLSDYRSNLKIHKVRLESRGKADILGLGEILKQVKEMIFHYLPNHATKLDNRIKKEKLIQLRIETLKKIGLNEKEIRLLVSKEEHHLITLESLFLEKKIIDIKIKDPSEETQ